MLRAPIWDSHFLPQLGERGGPWGLRGQWQSFEAEVDWGQGPLSSICLLTPSVVLTRVSLLCFYWVRLSSNTKNYVTPVHLKLLFYCICCRDLSSRANLTAQTCPTLSSNYYCLMDAFSLFFIVSTYKSNNVSTVCMDFKFRKWYTLNEFCNFVSIAFETFP